MKRVCCSLLLVCCLLGTLHDKHMHAWVATFHWDEDKAAGHVKFWETTSGTVYVLKSRFTENKFVETCVAVKAACSCCRLHVHSSSCALVSHVFPDIFT